MRNNYIKLTLANGKKPVIIRKEHIAFAMALQQVDENGNTEEFTRIIPQHIVIDKESNWLDVVETPDVILQMIGKTFSLR